MSLEWREYELLDFGRGRKLERFGAVLLDRPCPAAEGSRPTRTEAWAEAHARFERSTGDRGQWHVLRTLPSIWRICHSHMTLELRLTDFGHVGLFPEQVENWDWIARQVRNAEQSPKILNLFAYTGASTLAAAAVGAEVVHVDAARGSVAWARRNAAHSGLAERPIRWIVDDARKFVRREIKRGNRYDGLILDPPTYGHGASGEAWKLQEHLSELLAGCGELLSRESPFVLLTCHAPDVGPEELSRMLVRAMPAGTPIDCGALSLNTSDGRNLSSGVYTRFGERGA